MLLFYWQELVKLELWVTSPCLQYYDVQTLEYRYISKLPMKKERIWSYVKETTSHLQNKLTKNMHLGVAIRSSTKCLKPIQFHQYTWGLQHFLTFLQEDISHIKCYWFKINYLFLNSFYIANIEMWKFFTGTIFLHAHLQIVYYNCVKFHKNPIRRSCAYKIHALLLFVKVQVELSPLPNFGQPFRRSCAYKVHDPPFRESISWIISPSKF